MLNYLLTSFFLHAILLLALYYYAPGTASASKAGGAEKIEVTVKEKREALKFKPQAPILPKRSKRIEHGPGEGSKGNDQKVDLTDYGNQLKAVVDPVWIAKIAPLNLPATLFLLTEVLLFPDRYGNIISVKVIKSSGSRDFDQLALDALREVRQIPQPPESLVKEGIIWEFSNGERSP